MKNFSRVAGRMVICSLVLFVGIAVAASITLYANGTIYDPVVAKEGVNIQSIEPVRMAAALGMIGMYTSIPSNSNAIPVGPQ